MAQVVMMRHPQTGVVKKGFYGFSWTTLLFGGFPALFRGDLLVGAIVLLLHVATGCLVGLVWAFFYNRYYTTELLMQGFVFADEDWRVAEAKRRLNVRDPMPGAA